MNDSLKILDCLTMAQVVALKLFQQDACEDDHCRSRGTVERVSETQDAYTCAAAVAMLVFCTGDSSIQWPSDAGQTLASRPSFLRSLDCSTRAQVVALKLFQQNACEDDDWRSRGTVERVSEPS